MASKKQIAFTKSPTIEAVIKQLFKFGSQDEALGRLDTIKDNFILSKEQEKDDHKAAKLWIKGFALTKEEKKDGYLGNYALIRCKKVDGDKYTLYAEKIESELKGHPQKKRPKQKHPDWGHPILRSVKKGRVYKTLEEANERLELLHEEYSQVTIPGVNKLYIIVYGKAKKGQPPIQKYILEVQPCREGGGFYIESTENLYEESKGKKAGKKLKEDIEEAKEEPESPQGFFTSRETLKQSKKKK